jgi:hypothetical protein
MEKLVDLIIAFLDKLQKSQSSKSKKARLEVKTVTYFGRFNRVEAWQFRISKMPYPRWVLPAEVTGGTLYSIPSESGSKIYVQDGDWVTFRGGIADKLFSNKEFQTHYAKRRWYLAYAPYMLNVVLGILVGVFFFRPEYIRTEPPAEPIVIQEPIECPAQQPAEVRYVTKKGKTIYKKVVTKDLSIEEKLKNVRCAYSDRSVVCRDCTGISSGSDCLIDSFELIPWKKADGG